MCPADVAELERGEPEQVVRANALRKARAAWAMEPEAASGPERIVLGCDTLVSLDGVIHGKPADEQAARRTLEALAGATHEVLSGLALLSARAGGESGGAEAEGPSPREQVAVARTSVSFRALDRSLLDWYLGRGEWRGRAGGYAIQGAGAALVAGIEGDYENVVGLPVAALLDLCPGLLER